MHEADGLLQTAEQRGCFKPVLAAVLSHCMTGNGNCVDEPRFLIFTLLHVQSE